MGMIYGAGVNQGDLVTLLSLIKTNFNAILAKLDLDGGVADTDYTSTLAVSMAAGINTSGDKSVRDQGAVQTFLSSVVTNFNLLLAKLDLDGTVSSTNYVSTTAMTNAIGTAAGKSIRPSGMGQGSLVHLLDHVITQINALNAKLDGDSGVSGTNYASLWNITDTVVEAGTAA